MTGKMMIMIMTAMMMMILMTKIIAIMVSGLALRVEYRDVVQGLCGLQFEN